MIVIVSFWTTSYDILDLPAFTLQNYQFDVLQLDGDHLGTYLNTFKFCLIVWAITLALGFTVAYFLAFHVRTLTWQMALFLLCTIPFWTSQHHPHDLLDPVPRPQRHRQPALMGAGIIDQPLEWLLFSDFSVILGLRPPLHALHGGADLQLHGAHRQVADRGGARRRRLRLADALQRHRAACPSPAS